MNHDTVKNDYFWMAKAIQLAQQGRFTTSPNPRVGCVIVDENKFGFLLMKKDIAIGARPKI